MRGTFGTIVLIVVGGVALAHNLGYLNINLAHLVRTRWSLIVIGLGIGFVFPPDASKRMRQTVAGAHDVSVHF